jgi:hypothetical protein
MNKNPLFNASGAFAYIALVASFMFYVVPRFVGPVDTILMPISFISLLVLSVATMSYLFYAQPILLLVEGKKKEALSFFLRTIGIFAVIVVLLIGALILTS